jgi:hypothetical protein
MPNEMLVDGDKGAVVSPFPPGCQCLLAREAEVMNFFRFRDGKSLYAQRA